MIKLPLRTFAPLLGMPLALAGLVLAGYFYFRYQDAQAKLANPGVASAEQTKTLIERVGKLMELPTGEEPTIATVTDRERLKDQQFFAKSENGDRVLIYTQAKKAILYRPEINKIIDVAPLTIGNQATASATQSQGTVVLYNGTSVTGLTRTFESELSKKSPGLTVVDRDNARRQDYAQSIVVDVTGKRTQEAQAIAARLEMALGPLPAGEATPSSDFLIILGADKK